MIISLILSVLVVPMRQALLVIAFLCAVGYLWLERKAAKIRQKIEQFSEELNMVKSFEEGSFFDKAKERYQRLLGKYREIPEFTLLVKECLRRLEISEHLSIRKPIPRSEYILYKQAAAEGKMRSERSRKLTETEDRRDRRIHSRLSVDIRVGSVMSMGDSLTKHEATIKNISVGGALVESRLRFNLGDTIMLSSIPIPEGTTLQDVVARVVRVVEGHIHQAGLEFMYLEPVDIKRIEGYIQKAVGQTD